MDFLKRPRVVIAGTTLTLGAAGYGMYRVLQDVVMVLMVLVILILIVALFLIWRRQRQAAEASKEIESTISRQADQDIERSVPGQVAELESMKAELLAAIQALRASRRGQGALSTIPWYLVLGPAHSGKSTLVRQSGLSFPATDPEHQGPHAVRGVGGTRALEWWLSEDAVLLEMPGRLLATAEFEDSGDWLAFLSVLKKQRPLRPVHGVIVPVAIDQVADRPDTELDTLGRRVRERVQELIRHLRVSFPTYLVFTGCDRIAGFSEFFAEFDAQGRSRPWGATLAVEEAGKHPAEELFDACCRELEASLSRLWLKRLPRLPDNDQRARVFAFPRQLERMRPSMRRLVRALFDSGDPKERPLFRGFYFVSASPAGGAEDRALKEAAGTVGLVPVASPTPPPQGGGAWFVHQLFTKVIFPDRDLATESSAEVERRRRARIGLAAILGFTLLVLTVTLSSISCNNGTFASRTLRAAEHLKEVGRHGEFARRVAALDSLRSQIVELEKLERHAPWWRHLGGYWGDDLIRPALRVHAERALKDLVRPALPQMRQALESEISGGQPAFVDVFDRYWAWRVLMNPGEIDSVAAEVVGREVRRGLAADIEGVETSSRSSIAQKVEQNIAFLAEHGSLIGDLREMYSDIEARGLQDSAAAWLRAHWVESQFYSRMIQDAAQDPGVKPLDLAALAGPPEWLTASRAIAGPYTVEGWRAVQPRIGRYRARMSRPWVDEAFGERAKSLGESLERQYADAYAGEWQAFFEGIGAQKTSDWRTARGWLQDLTRDGSPFFKLLRSAAAQTDLGVDRATIVGQVAQDFQILQGFEASGSDGGSKKPSLVRRILRFFGGLFKKKSKAFDPTSSDKQRYREEMVTCIAKIDAYIDAGAGTEAYNRLLMGTAQEASAPAAVSRLLVDLSTKYRNRGTASVIHMLWVPMMMTPANFPPPQVGTDPMPGVKSTSSPVKGQMSPDDNNAWQQKVVPAFMATLAGKYPIAEGPDATPASFAEFFKPGGTFWGFYDARLKGYVTEAGEPVPGAEALVSGELAAAVRSARDIRDALFSSGGPRAELRFRMRPQVPDAPQPHPSISWTDIEVGGEALHWQTGPPVWKDMVWPGPNPGAGVRLSANAGGQHGADEKLGEWGFFRMLDRARVQDVGSTVRVTFDLSIGATRWTLPYELEFQGGSSRHPFRRGFLRFKLPASI